jgi:hypothetical protein
MPKRTRPRDINQLAKFIVDVSTGDATLPECQSDGRNTSAVERGRLGSQKGGKSRAERLTPTQRKKIAQKAAAKSWKKMLIFIFS